MTTIDNLNRHERSNNDDMSNQASMKLPFLLLALTIKYLGQILPNEFYYQWPLCIRV